jgi:hypothetical protein
MQTEIRFSCPECGQRYVAEGGSQGQALTCSACQTRFAIGKLPASAEVLRPQTSEPGSMSVSSGIQGRRRGNVASQLIAVAFGLVTPPALAAIAAICVFLAGFLPGAGKFLGVLAAAAVIPLLVNRFTKWYLATWGLVAFEYYKKSAGTAFLLLPGIAICVFLSLADESAGLLLVPIGAGAYFASALLAAGWLAGSKWADRQH